MEQTKCRICGETLPDKPEIDLGDLFISDFVNDESELTKLPMVMLKCEKCELVQIQQTPDLDSMYRKYWYKSSINNSMASDLRNIIDNVYNKIKVQDGDVVIDIGCNDGKLLSFYPKSITTIGYDPALSVADEARKNCSYFINDYFSAKLYPSNLPKAKVITAIAMFYDLPDPNSFIDNMLEVLDDDGIIVLQFTDLLSTLKINAIDNLCFEHIELYTLTDIIKLFRQHNMTVFDAEYNHVNGGSLRVYIARDRMINPTMYKLHVDESLYLEHDNLEFMKERINFIKLLIKKFIKALKDDGKNKIYALGASTKGNTFLQVFDLDSDSIIAVGEVNTDKLGLKTVTGIPIISEKEVLDANPDLIIILPWHFTYTFMKVTEEYVKNGGLVLYPLPIPVVTHIKDGKYDISFLQY